MTFKPATPNSTARPSRNQSSAEWNKRAASRFRIGTVSEIANLRTSKVQAKIVRSIRRLPIGDTARYSRLTICATCRDGSARRPFSGVWPVRRAGPTILWLFFVSFFLPIHAAEPAAGTPPERTKPTLVIIGDSTVHNRTRGQLGWGDVIDAWFDSSRITITNRALGGRSSRTFLTEGLWAKALADLKPGDFVLMQFGHNDGGPLDDGRARASLKGTGDESRVVTNKVSGKVETVHTYGWYMRQYIADAKGRKATPIVLSLVPRKIWKDGKVVRAANDYGKWAAEAAKAEGVAFVDLNDIVARHHEEMGPEKVDQLFADEHTHTNPDGARLNARCVIEGIRALKDCPLNQYIQPQMDTDEHSLEPPNSNLQIPGKFQPPTSQTARP